MTLGPPRRFVPICVRHPYGFIGGPSGYVESETAKAPIIAEHEMSDPEQRITEALKIERTRHLVEIWNICECGRVLHSVSEATRGTCASCWIAAMKPSTKKALNTLIASAFNGSTDAQKSRAVDDAFDALDNEKQNAKSKENR